MTSFVGMCNCRGRRPDGIISPRHYSRPELIARLLRERGVARFIVAPTGFGKSTLAFEYADIVFSFQHVFWVNGRSPCFLRDLDAGVLLKEIKSCDKEARLVVCDDLPPLSADRARDLGLFIDALLADGIEVIISCTPSADSPTLLQRDRVLLSGVDLLLSDDEMRAEEIAGRLHKGWEQTDIQSTRIACLQWGHDGIKTMLGGLKDEELSSDVRLAMLVFFALGEGSVDDLRMFLPLDRIQEIVSFLEHGYPFFNIEARMRTYRVIDIDTDNLSDAFCLRTDDLAVPSIHPDRDALCNCFADVLLSRGNTERGCAFMRSFAGKPVIAAWLQRRGWEVLSDGQPQAFYDLFDAIRRNVGSLQEAYVAMRAWASFMLEDVPAALKLAKRLTKTDTAKIHDRLCAAVLIAQVSEGDESVSVRADLDHLISEATPERGSKQTCGGRGALCNRWELSQVVDWVCLGRIVYALGSDTETALSTWRNLYEEIFDQSADSAQPAFEGLMCIHAEESGDALSDKSICEDKTIPTATYKASRIASLLLGAAWILDTLIPSHEQGNKRGLKSGESRNVAAQVAFNSEWTTSEDLKVLLVFIAESLDEASVCGTLSWFALMAGIAFERMERVYARLVTQQLTSDARAVLHREQAAFFARQDVYRKRQYVRSEKKRAFCSTHPYAFRRDAPETSAGVLSNTGIPLLNVRLFGGIEVRIGDQPLSPHALNWQKVRTTLAILVLNHGREVPKDRLVSSLWADSDLNAAYKNFYPVWSRLKRTLTLQNEKGCPYLIRSQEGCRIDSRFVTSDVFDFEALCRSLLFGTSEADRWEQLYAQVCEEYGEELMPGEKDNVFITATRQRYSVQLVDGLIAASARLREQGESRGSLWFAREALNRDSSREDVYVSLMEAQIASNQRSAALDTYFACRRFLTEELGIDPSARVMDLYHSIIEIEESLM